MTFTYLQSSNAAIYLPKVIFNAAIYLPKVISNEVIAAALLSGDSIISHLTRSDLHKFIT
jgi:hypothetical protein